MTPTLYRLDYLEENLKMPNISLDMTGQVPYLSKQQIMLLLINEAEIDYTGITGLMDIRGNGYGRVIDKFILLIDQMNIIGFQMVKSIKFGMIIKHQLLKKVLTLHIIKSQKNIFVFLEFLYY